MQAVNADVDTVFRERMQSSIDWLARALSNARKMEVVGTADVPQLILALARNTPSVDPAELEAGERLARAAQFKRDLIQRAGGALTTDGARELLGYKSAQAVHKAVAARRLLAVDDNGAKLYPAFQFDGGSIAPGIAAVLAATPTTTPWALLQFLVDGDEGMGDDRPMDLVKGGPDAVKRVASFARTLED